MHDSGELNDLIYPPGVGYLEKIKIGVQYGGACIIYGLLWLSFMSYFDWISIPSPSVSLEGLSLFNIVMIILLMPIIEEWVFRLLPIATIYSITQNKLAVWLVIVVSSVLFGYLHGSWSNIFIQGVHGLLFSKAFLSGGILSAVLAHMFVNGTILIFSYLL